MISGFYGAMIERKARNAPERGHFVPKSLVGGFACLELCLHGIRVLGAGANNSSKLENPDSNISLKVVKYEN